MARRSSSKEALIALCLEHARLAAITYKDLTGKPLGITGEIGEFEASRILGLTLAGAREAGFDAKDAAGRRYQIKTRAMPKNRVRAAQRLGRLKIEQPWDYVLFVQLDATLKPVEIWQASRRRVVAALKAPGSKARNVKSALLAGQFKRLAKKVWPNEAARKRRKAG